MDADSIIFIDTEFTSTTSEILELCVVNGAGKVLYHNHFKPVRAKWWRTFPHGITKTRVRHCRSFRRCLAEIQPLFDRAELVCGFAVDNDFRHLGEEGLKIDRDKALEVRNMYWELRHDTPKVADPFNLPGLSACAQELCPGLDLDAEHSAKGDTLTTYHLFRALADALPQHDWSDVATAWGECKEAYRQGVADYYRSRAHGYVVLEPVEGGYTMAMTQEPEAGDGAVVVEVADRFKAIGHFRDKFARRLYHNQEPYALRDEDLDYIRNYNNVFDPADWPGYRRLSQTAQPETKADEPAKTAPLRRKPAPKRADKPTGAKSGRRKRRPVKK